MSNYAIMWASQVQVLLSTREQFLLEVLADYANHDHECWPSMATLARRTRCNRATVYRLLNRLEHMHHLIVKVDGGGGRGRSNRYRLNVDTAPRLPVEIRDDQTLPGDGEDAGPHAVDLFGVVGTVYTDPEKGSHHATGGVAPDATGGVLHHATLSTEKGSHHATGGVAPDATGGVAPDATRSIKNPHEPKGSALLHVRLCGQVHVDPHTGRRLTCAEHRVCQFDLSEDTKALGLARIAEMRARLGQPQGCSLDGEGS